MLKPISARPKPSRRITSTTRWRRSRSFDARGAVRKTTVTESDSYWLEGVPVRREVKKDGRPLNADELAREDADIDKRAAKARDRRSRADAEDKATGPRGEDLVTVSRLLELGAFTNPRRVQLNGRDTIAIDFAGDPKAHTRNRAEEVIRDMVGTAWIDEQDPSMRRGPPLRAASSTLVQGRRRILLRQHPPSVHTSPRSGRRSMARLWLPATQIDGRRRRAGPALLELRRQACRSGQLGLPQVPDTTPRCLPAAQRPSKHRRRRRPAQNHGVSRGMQPWLSYAASSLSA